MERILSMLGLAHKAGRVEIGEEPVGSSARARKARVILVASDAAANTVSAMKNAAAQRETPAPILTLPCTKRELGGALGVRECAALAVLDTGFALALCRKLERSDLAPPLEERLQREKKRKAKKEAKKELKKAPQALKGAKGGAAARIAAKRARSGRGNTGPKGAKGPAEGRRQGPREQKPRVTGKRGN